MGDGFIWACFGVYGPNDNNVRGQTWDELIGIQQNIGMFHGVTLGISISFISQENGWVVRILHWPRNSDIRKAGHHCLM